MTELKMLNSMKTGMSLKFKLGAVALSAICFQASGYSLAQAADLGGDCCADLEERIAELEATTARKGNRKVSLTVAGQVNQMVMFWDDGSESNAYVVGNRNDQTNFSFTGDAKFAPGWSAGYELVLRVRDNLSDAVDQDNDNDVTGEGNFTIWQSHWFIENEKLGKVSVGRASRVTDTAPENDLSEAAVAGYAGVQDIGGGFLLRTKGGDLIDLAWGDVGNHFNGDTANLVRYDTPELMGFVASVSWGEDDIWDVGLKYEGEGGGFKLAASIAYTEITDGDGEFAENDESTIVGSFSVLHDPSGLNLTVAAGERQFDDAIIDADGDSRTAKDARFIYAKAGWLAKLTGLGPTAFYGEYGRFEDFVTVGEFGGAEGLVSQLGGDDNTRITGSDFEVFGVGVVQHIEAAEMQLYLGYRLHEVEFDLADDLGGVSSNNIDDFHTVVSGAKISF
jgi:hypothetical protein